MLMFPVVINIFMGKHILHLDYFILYMNKSDSKKKLIIINLLSIELHKNIIGDVFI